MISRTDLKTFINRFGIISLRLVQKCWISADKCPANGIAQTPDTDKRADRKLPKILLAVFYYLNFKMLVQVCLQLNYDVPTIHLNQIRNLSDPLLSLGSLGAQIEPNSSSVANLEQRAREARALLKSFGGPWPEMHLVSVAGALIMITISTSLYSNYQLLVWLKLMHPLDLYLLRMLLTRSRELEYCHSMASEVVAKMKLSSMNHSLNWTRKSSRPLTVCPDHGRIHLELVRGLRDTRVRRPSAKSIHQPNRSHLFLARLAEQMLASKQLIPPNRSSEARVERNSFRFGLIVLVVGVHSIAFDFGTIFGLSYLFGYLELANWMDVWLICEVFLFLCYVVVGSALLLASLGCIVLDQKDYLEEVHQGLVEHIEHSERLFAAKAERWRNSDSELERDSKRFNGSLMAQLVHLSVFLKQFRPTQETFHFIANTSFITIGLLYLVMRLLMPYLSPIVTSLGIYIGLVVVILADCITVPICRINQLGLELYTTLLSLLVQAVRQNEQTIAASGRPLYLNGLIWVLRQMTSDTHRFMAQFKAHVCGRAFSVSWLNLFRLHLVIGLLLGSAFFQANSWRVLAGDRIDNPLGKFLTGRWFNQAG